MCRGPLVVVAGVSDVAADDHSIADASVDEDAC